MSWFRKCKHFWEQKRSPAMYYGGFIVYRECTQCHKRESLWREYERKEGVVRYPFIIY